MNAYDARYYPVDIDRTGFSNGDLFASADQVRAYFTAAEQTMMHGEVDAVTDQALLDEWAEYVIEHRIHMSIPIFARQPGHDGGFDLVVGRDVTNESVGTIYWDDSDGGGLVCRLYDDDEYLPDDAADAASWLAQSGYGLDADSLVVIDALAERTTPIETLAITTVDYLPGHEDGRQRLRNHLAESIAQGWVGRIEVRGHWEHDTFMAEQVRYWDLEEDCWSDELGDGGWDEIR